MAMSKQVPLWVAIVGTVSAFLLTLLFGSGAFWEWRKTTVQLTAERTKASADIRDRMRVLLAEIMKYQSDPAYLEAHVKQFGALIEDYNALERGLAELEGRDPVRYGFPPPTPTLTVK
jgi:hypothetical protein